MKYLYGILFVLTFTLTGVAQSDTLNQSVVRPDTLLQDTTNLKEAPESLQKLIEEIKASKTKTSEDAELELDGMLFDETRTKSGTSESKIPAIELLTCICANGKRNIGKKFPKKPVIAIHFICFRDILRKAGMPIGAIINPETPTRIAPISSGVKAISDFLIKMKELPQVSASIINKNQRFSKAFPI